VRPDAPLSFFHPDGPAGPRYRLVSSSGSFAEVGGDGVHQRAALLTALDAEPLRFSTSALLRPIAQDVLLPTAAYVGGPAEVQYFAQLEPLYAAYELRVPLVVPRARLRILEDRAMRLLSRLGLEPDDAQRAEDDLLATCAGDRALGETVRTLSSSFDAALDAVRTRLEEAGPGLPSAIEKTRATVRMAVSRLAERADKALAHQDARLVDDVRRLKLLLHPNDVPQERVYGVSWFAARYGERAFVERVLGAITPFDPTPRDVHP
jgi:uncharacterized protein YllA (UPF0747 family)